MTLRKKALLLTGIIFLFLIGILSLATKALLFRSFSEVESKSTGSGYSEGELIGSDSLRIVFPADVKTVRENAVKMLKKERTSPYEYRIINKNGEIRWIMETVASITYRGKRAALGSFMDITERRLMEEALKTSEASYRAIFNAVNDAIFVHDPETGDILDVNEKMAEMYGYALEDARGLKIEALSKGEPPYDRENALRLIKEAAQGTPRLFEWAARAKDGRRFWVEVNLKRAFIGGRERVLAVVRDITARKNAEKALKESEQKYRTIFEDALNPFSFWTKTGAAWTQTGPAWSFWSARKKNC
ncbi:MAG: PAS domain S-box protein [Bacillota bacterium]